MTFFDASFLLSTYLIIQDKEIHSNELRLLNELFPNVSENAIIQKSEILSDSEDKIPLDTLLRFIASESEENKVLLMSNLIKLVVSDKYYHPKEEAFITSISEIINFDKENLLKVLLASKKEMDDKYQEKIQGFYSNLKEGISNIFYKISGDEMFEQNLLEGKEFVNRIKQIAARSHNDLELATENMYELNHTLEENYTKLNILSEKIKKEKRSDKDSNSLVEFMSNLNDNTMNMLKTSLSKNIEVHDKKKHTIDYFTIAFLGRTKAGKSTFHKVITGEETDDIGVGSLRTTRFNRVFNWENIRVVDTPGIGAPGGNSDTETARSIIDEADLVCYLVTNDAIQETEFKFLSELKEKNKPIFIILNCKDNLDQPIRLKKFLKNPLAWKENTGDKSIQGHIDRIKEMISKNYDANLIEILPIHLLAAKLSKSTTSDCSESDRKLLLHGSNIAEYNKKIKQTVFRNGHLKKTQNIIDGCNNQVSLVGKMTQKDLETINNLIKNLDSQKENILKFIKDRRRTYKDKLIKVVASTHNDMSSQLNYFAENNYENKNISEAWVKFIEEKEFYIKMQLLLEKEIANYQEEISDKMEEVMSDISMNFNSFELSQISVDTNDYRFYGNAVIGIASLTLGIVAFTAQGWIAAFIIANGWNPIGWIGGGLAVAGLIFNYTTISKEKRIKKAVNKIIDPLKKNILDQERKITQNFIANFEKNADVLNNTIVESFDTLINSSKSVSESLKEINRVAVEKEDLFNKILVYRILEHLKQMKDNIKLTTSIINEEIKDIEINRKGEYIKIKSKFNISPMEQREITKALQLNIEFIN